MITEYEIALARSADAQAIAELSHEAIEYGLPWRWTPSRVLQAIREASTNVVVARREGRVVPGFAIMQYGDETAHLALLAVRAEARRQGMASALLAWLEASARVAGIRQLRLEVRRGNPTALAFYAHHGFAESGVSAGYYEGVEDAIRMIKPLAAAAAG